MNHVVDHSSQIEPHGHISTLCSQTAITRDPSCVRQTRDPLYGWHMSRVDWHITSPATPRPQCSNKTALMVQRSLYVFQKTNKFKKSYNFWMVFPFSIPSGMFYVTRWTKLDPTCRCLDKFYFSSNLCVKCARDLWKSCYHVILNLLHQNNLKILYGMHIDCYHVNIINLIYSIYIKVLTPEKSSGPKQYKAATCSLQV
jgi:hypothetical protein